MSNDNPTTTNRRTCPECNGTGEVQHPLYGTRSCPEPWAVCPRCGGEGVVEEENKEVDHDE